MAHPQRRQIGFGTMLLLYQLFSSNEYIPPVTLATIVGQLAIFLGFIPALDIHRVGNICLNPNAIWHGLDWQRLFTATVVHADEWHLYYNMISFLWKGRRLERKFGSAKFAVVLILLTALTSVTHVLLSVGIGEKLGVAGGYGLMRECAVGFSGVIFALKVLVNHYFPAADQWIMGIFPVPSRYACWAELAIIQLLVPRVSFVGHLAGILAGLAFVHGPAMHVINALFSSYNHNPYFNSDHSYQQQSTGYRPRPATFGNGYAAHPDQYTGGLSEEEQMEHILSRSQEQNDDAYNTRWRGGRQPPPYPTAPHGDGLYPRL